MSGLRVVGATAAGVVLAVAPAVAWFEGMIPYTYVDPVGIPTACGGETGPHIVLGQTYTMEQCLQMLDASLWRHWRGLERCISADVTPAQAQALLSWTYNVGVGAACRSTLARMLNAGAPAAQWCHQLMRWTKARVMGVLVDLPGLVKRRRAELAMCLDGGEWRLSLRGRPWHQHHGPLYMARIDRRLSIGGTEVMA